MGYVEQSLGANEVVHYRAYLPFLLRVLGWGILLLSLAGGAMIYTRYPDWRLAAAAIGLIGIVIFLAIMIPIWTTEIAVTNNRLIFKRGLIRRSTADLQLRAIEQVGLQQGVLGRLFNIGHVEIHGTGVDDVHLPPLDNPVALQKAIQEARGHAALAGSAKPVRS